MFPVPTIDPAIEALRSLENSATGGMNALISSYYNSYHIVWNNIGIFDILGTDWKKVFEQAEKGIQAILILNPDFVPPPAPYEYTINEDGSVTVWEKIDPNFWVM